MTTTPPQSEREELVERMRKINHQGVNMMGEPRFYPVTDHLVDTEIDILADFILAEKAEAQRDVVDSFVVTRADSFDRLHARDKVTDVLIVFWLDKLSALTTKTTKEVI